MAQRGRSVATVRPPFLKTIKGKHHSLSLLLSMPLHASPYLSLHLSPSLPFSSSLSISHSSYFSVHLSQSLLFFASCRHACRAGKHMHACMHAWRQAPLTPFTAAGQLAIACACCMRIIIKLLIRSDWDSMTVHRSAWAASEHACSYEHAPLRLPRLPSPLPRARLYNVH